MLNMIKMDLYRMFRTKSMYVVWIVLAVSVLFTTFMCKTDYDSLSKEDTVQQEQFAEPTAERLKSSDTRERIYKKSAPVWDA